MRTEFISTLTAGSSFQDHIGFMNEYLSSDNIVKPNFIIIKNISFITSCGAKSILLAYEKEEENSNGNLRKEEDAHDSTLWRRNEEST